MENGKHIPECKTNKHSQNFFFAKRINYHAYENKIGCQRGLG
jgi:hypothetical protein